MSSLPHTQLVVVLLLLLLLLLMLLLLLFHSVYPHVSHKPFVELPLQADLTFPFDCILELFTIVACTKTIHSVAFPSALPLTNFYPNAFLGFPLQESRKSNRKPGVEFMQNQIGAQLMRTKPG